MTRVPTARTVALSRREVQRDDLLVLGCRRAQGRLYGHPRPGVEVELGAGAEAVRS